MNSLVALKPSHLSLGVLLALFLDFLSSLDRISRNGNNREKSKGRFPMPIWNCAARVGLKGRVDIFTVVSAPAREFFGGIPHIFLCERQGLVHLSLEGTEDSIKINLFKRNKRTKNGILRKVSFTIPGNTEIGQRLRSLAGRNSVGRLQYAGEKLYLYPETLTV